MAASDWIPWGIVALTASAQLIEILRSSNAHKSEIKAKDAALAAKDAQLETLRELTSVRVREHYLATKAQLEQYVEDLKRQLEESERETLALRDDHISKKVLLDRLALLQADAEKQLSAAEQNLKALMDRELTDRLSLSSSWKALEADRPLLSSPRIEQANAGENKAEREE